MLMLLGHPSFILAILDCRDHMMEGAPKWQSGSGYSMTSDLFPEVFKTLYQAYERYKEQSSHMLCRLEPTACCFLSYVI